MPLLGMKFSASAVDASVSAGRAAADHLDGKRRMDHDDSAAALPDRIVDGKIAGANPPQLGLHSPGQGTPVLRSSFDRQRM